METTLKNRILTYYQKHPEWISSGSIQRMVQEKTKYTAQNAGRRLRELHSEGLLQVEYRKGHAWYKLASKAIPERSTGILEGKELEEAVEQMGIYFDTIPKH